MGAAAVFDTAAEIPPTVPWLVAVSLLEAFYGSAWTGYKTDRDLNTVYLSQARSNGDVLKKSTTKP